MTNELRQFFKSSLRALIRAERDGRVSARFSDTGRDLGATFRYELPAAGLVTLCIEDAGATAPAPFNLGLWRPNWPARARLSLSSAGAGREGKKK